MPRKEKNRAKDRKHHYTYLIRDLKNRKVYYGVHSTDYDPHSIEDYYSSSKHLKLIIEREGFDSFTKEVRRFFPSREDADRWEAKVLRRINAKDHKDFYNKANGDSNFVASGYVTVKIKGTEDFIRVPVEDPYIGIFYDYASSGRTLTQKEKDNLSELYKDKWVGGDNPVHYLKEDKDWRLKISKGNVGKSLSESQKSYLRRPEQWQHINDTKPSEKVKSRMSTMRSVNNNKYLNIYAFKGEIYLHQKDLPVTVKHKEVRVLNEKHPEIDTLSCEGKTFRDIKVASEYFGVARNTIKNRVASTHETWEDYFYLTDSYIKKVKEESLIRFKSEMEDKHRDLLIAQKEFIRPFSLGMDDEDLKNLFNKTGSYLKGTRFVRTEIKDTMGSFSWIEVYCPLCSSDKYVQAGVCNGKFLGTYGNLKRGNNPCRCGSSKSRSLDISLYEIKLLCEQEGMEYLGVSGEVKGHKETKVKYICRKGNITNTTRVDMFLAGSRCKCCVHENKKLDIPKINLSEEFTFRKELYKEKYEQ